MITIYGLKNCDSCRKAFNWLDSNNYDYNFHDFKNFSLSDSLLSKWIETQNLFEGAKKIIDEMGAKIIQQTAVIKQLEQEIERLVAENKK